MHFNYAPDKPYYLLSLHTEEEVSCRRTGEGEGEGLTLFSSMNSTALLCVGERKGNRVNNT